MKLITIFVFLNNPKQSFDAYSPEYKLLSHVLTCTMDKIKKHNKLTDYEYVSALNWLSNSINQINKLE